MTFARNIYLYKAGATASTTVTGTSSSVGGFAQAVTANNAILRSTGAPSHAGGLARANGFDSTIEATSTGALAYGYSGSYPGYGATRLRATGIGATAFGACQYFGDIEATAQGALAHGDVFGLAGRGGFITASGRGSTARGFAAGTIQAIGFGSEASGYTRTGTVATTALIRATGLGARAHGNSNNVDQNCTIEATGAGSTALGYTSTIVGDTGPALIRAAGDGSVAAGVAFYGDSTVEARLEGGFAIGAALGYGALSAGVIAAMPGSFAVGLAAANGSPGLIYSNENGAFAMGKASGGTIQATAEGTFALGVTEANATFIEATAEGAFAMGRAILYDVRASATGSFAVGHADTADIQATADNAVQFGPGTNSVADTVRIGVGGLHLKGTAGAFGVLANGQFWISGGNVYVQSGGATQNLTNVP